MKDKKLPSKVRIRKYLNADALFKTIKQSFEKIPDHRQDNLQIALSDAFMSAFAMFSLKDPSLLAFEERRKTDGNLKTIYQIGRAPCDTQMRTTLDDVDPETLRSAFKEVFLQL